MDRRFLCNVLLVAAAVLGPLGSQAYGGPAQATFEQGVTFVTFLSTVDRLPTVWARALEPGQIPDRLTRRLERVRTGLEILVVAEDWCVDSANTVPVLAALARSAGVELRIVNRATGEDQLDAHRTADGRSATPLVVLIREGKEVGAWVERPAPLRAAFVRLLASAGDSSAAENRQAWYDADKGRTALAEIVELAERTWRGR